jgi:hypothetical protein
MIENGKIIKVTIIILVLLIIFLFIFNFGINFYNKLRCNSRDTINKMINYCQKNNLQLRDMKFEDGLCISVCGK